MSHVLKASEKSEQDDVMQTDNTIIREDNEEFEEQNDEEMERSEEGIEGQNNEVRETLFEPENTTIN